MSLTLWNRLRPVLLPAMAVTEVAALGALAWGNPAFPSPALWLFALAFAAYGAACWSLVRRGGARADAGTWAVIWATAILARLLLLPAEPRLSDDVYRYLWDGHVQLSGVNPYRFAPADPALAELRTPWHSLINNPAVSTIYPPLAQMVFVLIALLGSSVVAAKAVWVALDLLAGAALTAVARATGRPAPVVAALYLWSPLLIVETAWSGHLEALGLASLCVLLLALQRNRNLAGGLALAAAALTKFAPLAALPALVRRLGTRGVGLAVLAVVVLYLPYVGAGAGLWAGLETYARHWRFNEGAFAVIEWALPGPLRPRVVTGLLVVGTIVVVSLRRFAPDRALLWILGAGIALSPTVHPWYVLWVLPFAALSRNRAWLYLSGAVFLGYWGLDTFQGTGDWPEPALARLTVWIPFYGLLLWQAVRRRRPEGGAQEQP